MFLVYLPIEITLSVFLERLKNSNRYGTNVSTWSNLLILKWSYNLDDDATLTFSAVTLPLAPALLHEHWNIVF